MPHFFRKALTALGVWMAHPAVFLIWFAYVIAWIFVQPETLDWHAAAALMTWLMTLFIQRAEHRDTQAIHAKLDEVLKAMGDARTDLRDIDKKEPEEIEAERRRERAQ